MHTERTQNAHTQNTENTEHKIQHRIPDTEQNTRYNNMQHIQDNTEQENREQNTQHSAQPQHTPDTDYLHKYNFDIYHEYVAINNSNTIELYTISKENI